MTRVAIEMLLRRMNAAYQDDPFHALRKNLASVLPEEWDVRPPGWVSDDDGAQPQPTIAELVLHVAAPKYVFADHAFGDATMRWRDVKLPALDRESVLAWLDEGQRRLVDGLAALEDDVELALERPTPWEAPHPERMRRDQFLAIVMNHDLYHSGEINRQRALLRGSDGWAPTPS